ncbi:MCP methyltransferase, CheR-type [Desulfonatronum zhilinae]|nr:MCP methyltransferase, CheR-type [Desulfonatronum zhilinae]
MTAPSRSVAEPSPELLSRLGALIGEKMGLRFSEDKLEDLRRGVLELSTLQGFESPTAFVRNLLDSSLNEEEIQLLAGRLTTGETYFFREQNILRALQEHVLREVIAARWPQDRTLRIWCAGCSSGEEPYTMAMLLDQTLPEPSSWTIRILGTDINPLALEKARHGIYSRWSFRGVSATLRDSHFTPVGSDRYAIKPRFRANVSFAHLNLATDTYPSLLNATSGLDVIVCRNVMIYLLPETIRRVIHRFHRCLVDGGWLIVSPSESSQLLATEFTPIHLTDATVYRKGPPSGSPETSFSPTTGWKADTTIQTTFSALDGQTSIPSPSPAYRASSPAAASPFTVSKPPPEAPQKAISDPPPASLSNASKDSPDPSWPEYEQAALAVQEGRAGEAEALLQALLSGENALNPHPRRRIRVLRLMARIQADLGRSDAALDWCEQALAVDKTDPQVLYLQGMILQEMGRDKDARQPLKRLLYLDPDCIAAHAALAGIALREHDSGQAERYFNNVLDLLADLPRDAPIPEMGGLSAGRLMETIHMLRKEGR